MTKFQYIQFTEIIKQRTFRQNYPFIIFMISFMTLAFAFITVGFVETSYNSISFYTPIGLFFLVFSITLGLFRSSSEKLLKKLKKDFEEGKDIDLNEYCDNDTKDE